jgi:hypothetical protein
MEKPLKHLSEGKIKTLQDAIGFLDNYMGDDKEVHFVKSDGDGEIHIGKTQALAMLAMANKTRAHLIEELLK